MKPAIYLSSIAVLAVGLMFYTFKATNTPQKIQQSPRLYIMDGGIIEKVDPGRFGLKKEDVATDRFAIPIYLVVHPKGTLIWETGAVPDTAWKYTGAPVVHRLVLPTMQRDITVNKPLSMQLAEIGHTAASITYLALSHYHYDHTGNANAFANSTWLVRQNEHDSMFAKPAPDVTQPSSYAALRKSKTQFITKDEYDVFGDGTVILKSAPGHTPGHQLLLLRLAKTGNIVLCGDLYHYPAERTLDRVPVFEYNAQQTRNTRIAIDSFLKRTGAKLWIQHDFAENQHLKKSPEYYE